MGQWIPKGESSISLSFASFPFSNRGFHWTGIDTDAMAKVDDQHALAYALFSGNHFEVEGITVNRGSDAGQSYHRDLGIDDHFAEAVNVVKMCNADVPVLKGPAGNYQQLKGDI